MHLPNICILVSVRDKRIQDKQIHPVVFQLMVQRQMINTGGLHIDPDGQIVLPYQGEDVLNRPLHRPLAAVQYLISSADTSCDGRTAVIRLKSTYVKPNGDVEAPIFFHILSFFLLKIAGLPS